MRTPFGASVACALALALAAGCAEQENRPPRLGPVDDQTFVINQQNAVSISAEDPDGDPRTYSFQLDPPLPPNSGGAPELTTITDGLAQFTWTPRITALGGERSKTYNVTFTVTDDRGGKDAETVAITLVDDGVGGSSALRFIEPVGAGMSVGTPCVTDLPVEVRAEAVASEEVVVEMVAPLLDGARLEPGPGVPGKLRRFNWCPTAAQLDASLSHTVTFAARELGGDEPVIKRFLFRFKRTAAAECPGAPPEIQHSPEAEYSGPLNYDIQATIRDDVGFKAPPVLTFVVNPADDPRAAEVLDTSGWQLATFESVGGDQWRAAIPNLGLAEGQSAQVFYQIVATDNDDPNGSACDHTAESRVYRFIARGGGQAAGRTYGFCQPCVADAQCGGEADRCVSLRGEAFCGVRCEGAGDCAGDAQCLAFTSVDGVETTQCVPADLNCGQICVDDGFDAGGDNNDPARAAQVGPGTTEGLSICAGDVDYFRIPVQLGQSLRVRAQFDNAAGDLDLAMAMPGDPEGEFNYQSLNGDVNEEAVHEPCAAAAGEALVVVFGFENAENSYDLVVETAAGQCDQMCRDDAYDQGAGNDRLEDFTAVELPFSDDDLVICREDPDVFGFAASAGEVIEITAVFEHRAGDLDMQLYNSNGAVAVSDGYRDIELIEYVVPAEDIYLLEVYGATRSVANDYLLEIRRQDVQMCQSTLSCPAGTYCTEAGCVDELCASFDQCAPGHTCVAPRAGADPAAAGGACAARCNVDRDCRADAGYRCKWFEDFSRGCAVGGAATTGQRCTGYRDCAGADVCFPVPGGYCAAAGCSRDRPCPQGTVCATLMGFDACLLACEDDGDCRAQDGHRCVDVGGGRRGCQP